MEICGQFLFSATPMNHTPGHLRAGADRPRQGRCAGTGGEGVDQDCRGKWYTCTTFRLMVDLYPFLPLAGPYQQTKLLTRARGPWKI